MAMRHWILITLAAILFASGSRASAAEDSSAAALQAALVKNADHAREWLDQKDKKSLAQSAATIQFLADLTKSKSDDAAWQSAFASVVTKAGELQKAASGGADLADCKTALEALEKVLAAAGSVTPRGKSRSLPRPPAVRSLMLIMDAVQGDAKVALLTGNVPAAKKQAFVLAELGKLVSDARTTDGWASLAGDFAKAATAAAISTENDPKTVRELFRGVALRCETCHESNRTR
jgi:hypothetical protein